MTDFINLNDFTRRTLGELVTIPDEIIHRNAMSILKRLQNCKHERQDYRDHFMKLCTTCGMGFPQK